MTKCTQVLRRGRGERHEAGDPRKEAQGERYGRNYCEWVVLKDLSKDRSFEHSLDEGGTLRSSRRREAQVLGWSGLGCLEKAKEAAAAGGVPGKWDRYRGGKAEQGHGCGCHQVTVAHSEARDGVTVG